MRLLLVHGRGQGERSEEELRRDWTAALERGYDAAGVDSPRDVDIRLPFYGALLDELTAKLHQKAQRVIARGDDPEPVDDFQRALVLALAQGAGISPAEVEAAREREVVARGPENWEIVQVAAQLLSRRVPWLTRAGIARYTADVDAYLNFPHVQFDVNQLILGHIDAEPTVVVGHSLGSVVAYSVLAGLAGRLNAPLFVTIGAPLGVGAIKDRLRRPLGIPAGVRRWLNASDERDPVALFSRLDASSFVGGIENHTKVRNPSDWAHWIGGYLADAHVAKSIAAALSGT
ncbi:MAG: alpha/beta fold hydrolase [Egibacteraceae bacterium]